MPVCAHLLIPFKSVEGNSLIVHIGVIPDGLELKVHDLLRLFHSSLIGAGLQKKMNLASLAVYSQL